MSLLALVSAISPSVKVRHIADKAVIDNVVFRAHYRLTTSIFFASCAFITATNLLGDPINCIVDKAIPKHVINTFCWMSSTYTWRSRFDEQPTTVKNIINNEIQPGVGPIPPSGADGKIYHAYYQWVPFMLFFHGLCFYLPHLIWKMWEGGDIKRISDGIRGTTIMDNGDRKKKRARVADYVKETLHMHSKYAYTYFLCELLNFLNVIATMYLIDRFLNGAFLEYGMDVLKFTFLNQEHRFDPMIKVFPRVTKCTFNKFGSGGGVQNHDALCILALNNLNEKIYIFLWFWLLSLGVITFLALAYTAALITMPWFRRMIMSKRFKFGSKYNVNRLIQKTQSGDFLLLHLLGQNLSTMTFRHLLDDLNDKLHASNRNKSYPNGRQPATNSHSNDEYPIYPNISSMDTMALDRFQTTDALIHAEREKNV